MANTIMASLFVGDHAVAASYHWEGRDLVISRAPIWERPLLEELRQGMTEGNVLLGAAEYNPKAFAITGLRVWEVEATSCMMDRGIVAADENRVTRLRESVLFMAPSIWRVTTGRPVDLMTYHYRKFSEECRNTDEASAQVRSFYRHTRELQGVPPPVADDTDKKLSDAMRGVIDYPRRG
jgi:hypothetical protein